MRGLGKNTCGRLMQALKEGEDGENADTGTFLSFLR